MRCFLRGASWPSRPWVSLRLSLYLRCSVRSGPGQVLVLLRFGAALTLWEFSTVLASEPLGAWPQS